MLKLGMSACGTNSPHNECGKHRSNPKRPDYNIIACPDFKMSTLEGSKQDS